MFLLEVGKGITFVEGERRGRFPFGNVLVLSSPGPTGRLTGGLPGGPRVLVDTGAGDEILEAVTASGPVEIVINTHYHIDHIRGNGRFGLGHGAPPQPGHGASPQPGHGASPQPGHGASPQPGHGAPLFWCPQGESAAISTWEGFLEFTGFGHPGFEEARLFRRTLGWTPTPIAREIGDGETLDFDGAAGPRVIVLRLPGHTPGHSGLWFPDERVIFSADIDLSGFGPWYGDVYGDIDDYLLSVRRLEALAAEVSLRGRRSATILTSHRRPMTYADFVERLPRFVAQVEARDERLLGLLIREGPLTLEAVVNRWPIYGPHAPQLPGIRKSEYFMAKHHLKRLARAGRVLCDDGGIELWRVP
jgi:ribonuclease/clavin/mitogillin